ncbi:MAG: polyhydroxyalkanoate depolymerase [Alphaproteobacteria bacterium]|nr:polyhydroxyalkanoate depolymerase [Alphaproteobacteria bacterium]
MFRPFDPYGTATGLTAALLGTPVLRAGKPSFGIAQTVIAGAPAAVREVAVLDRPFCTLLHFEREGRRNDPRMLLVAPLAGHFAVMMRDTVAALLPDHDVFVTDWADARQVPLKAGPFGLADNIGTVMDFLRHLGPETHVMGLCQSAVPALAATALLAAMDDRATPRSLILMAGTVDPRVGVTRVDRLLAGRSLDWYERNVIVTVPAGPPGAGRRIYPGVVQLAGLLAYLARHIADGRELARKLALDDGLDALRHPFFAHYVTMMDLTAEFFLENVQAVFRGHDLPRGRLRWRGQTVQPAAISRTALMTVEGDQDDVSGPGQTRAAQDLCAGIPADRRAHYVQPGVGHFGTYHGARWRDEIVPRIRDFVRARA